MADSFYAYTVPLATQYRFRVTDGANVQTIDRSSGTLRLNMLALYNYATAYTVEVAVMINGIWGTYGTACTVNSNAASTRLKEIYCGTQVGFADSFYAYSVSLATQYRFRIVNGANVQTIDRPSASLKLNMLTSYDYATAYTVDVAILSNGIWSAYGPSCIINSPALSNSQIRTEFCGTQVEFAESFYAYTVPLATQYRFRIVNGANVQTVDRPTGTFKLNMLASYDYSTAYTIDVAVMINGAWNQYGPSCIIYSPALPHTQLKDKYCGVQVTANTTCNAHIVPLATTYRFRVTEGANVHIIDRPTASFKLSLLPSYEYDTAYTVDIAIMVNGTWGEYGPTCIVTTLPLAGRFAVDSNDKTVSEEQSPLLTNAFAYPNPASDVFAIKLESQSSEQVHIQVYEITGKQVENISVTPEELEWLSIGQQYAAGIYTIIVTQGSYQKSIKVVKK